MRQYEMMIIIDPSQDERTVAPSLDKYLDIVRKENGSVEKVDIWGKRRLEYPINKKDEGIYVVLDLKCESATVLEIDRLLNINDQILRTKVLRKDQ
ncbi:MULTISPECIES: 30S ribosomal protein S6 [Corynebacterium]|uniref:Small ribosomal subunit protein bS6 n=1 Tax=Corynebacterium jeikeium (strain K411) TaxID=306537 RepID=RS6_CORJK|nr:30S ribosomal protein S6 [Corynebacterium jeikeium]Q4JSF9.1 RecName: Full=Small ribosomal subunit protein bS6; AltName: Full=30S ribosomal protein S6 [Corynebacterium jeikeium K411]MCG7259274.1 30S ribosomal protein S6 [Corynebacterium sp. ACRQK]MCG7263573.1 30S ribosomal protein S6 [Corynebacterium sp. ACRQL]CAI38248.1 30S ribosomal protein S6 [Corynebacterium jeikeium K411]